MQVAPYSFFVACTLVFTMAPPHYIAHYSAYALLSVVLRRVLGDGLFGFFALRFTTVSASRP